MTDTLPPYPEYKDSGVPWLGDIPTHWYSSVIRRYSHVFAGATPSRAVLEYWTNGTIPWLSSGDVNLRRIHKTSQFITEAGFAASSTKWIRPRSLVLALAGQGRTKGMVATVEIWTTCNQSLAVIEPKLEQVDHQYLAYYLESKYLQIRALVGDGLRDGLNLEHVKALPTPIPPRDEQAAIVRFLDAADQRIRRYIRAKQRLIGLLNEQKQAIIQQAVTRGLDPDVPLKPSGVEWLGDIPAHWDSISVRRLITFITSGSRGWAEFYSDDGDMFIQSGNLGRSMALDFKRLQYVHVPPGEEGQRTRIQQYDVLVCITGALTGNVAIVDEILPSAYINQHVALLRPKFDLVVPRYLAYSLHSRHVQAQFKVSEYGGTKQGLGLDEVCNIVVFLPNKQEQQGIVDTLDTHLDHILKAIKKIEKEIDYMREYRTRLIADVVTGKIDVRAAAFDLPESFDDAEPLDEIEALAGDELPEVGDGDES